MLGGSTMDRFEMLAEWQYKRLGSEALSHALKVQSEVLQAGGEFLR